LTNLATSIEAKEGRGNVRAGSLPEGRRGRRVQLLAGSPLERGEADKEGEEATRCC